MHQVVTTTPTALAGLTVGTAYTVQNQSAGIMLLVRAQAAPAATDHAFSVEPFEAATVKRQDAGDEIYVWRPPLGTDGVAEYDEVA